MRQAQHNKRSRGRGRKSSSPGNRVYESNGPDVKVRGNASHIAEKYVNLARDASSSGDLVAAENYFQHAEHYFRLVAASQTQVRQDQAQNRPSHGSDQQGGQPTTEGADSIEAEDAGQDKSANDAGSNDASEKAEGGRSPGRNRRPTADRRTVKSGNGDDSSSEASSVQVTNGADVEEPVVAEVEQVAQTSSRPGDEGAAPEDVAEAEAEL